MGLRIEEITKIPSEVQCTNNHQQEKFPWQVFLTKRVVRGIKNLPSVVNDKFQKLLHQLEVYGPMRGDWSNFSKIASSLSCYHCHLKGGTPTYVCIWEVEKKTIKIIYAGPHQGANYDNI